jgi:hypothetical protein
MESFPDSVTQNEQAAMGNIDEELRDCVLSTLMNNSIECKTDDMNVEEVTLKLLRDLGFQPQQREYPYYVPEGIPEKNKKQVAVVSTKIGDISAEIFKQFSKEYKDYLLSNIRGDNSVLNKEIRKLQIKFNEDLEDKNYLELINSINDNLKLSLVLSVLFDREMGITVYKNSEGELYMNERPNIGSWDYIAPSKIQEDLIPILFMHTHHDINRYNPKEKKFDNVNGFSSNVIDFSSQYDIGEDGSSDWFSFLNKTITGYSAEVVLSSNLVTDMVIIKPFDLKEVEKRLVDYNIYIETSFLTQEGVMKEVTIKHLLGEIENFVNELDTTFQDRQDVINRIICDIFSFNMYRGKLGETMELVDINQFRK